MRKLIPTVLLLGALIGQMASAKNITVTSTIQAAVDQAQPGDTIFVPPGIYRESVRVSKDNISIVGGKNAVLDGTGLDAFEGILVRSLTFGVNINGFNLDGMEIRNFSSNGIRLVRVNGFHITRGTFTNNEYYGVFPVRCFNGLVDHNKVTGSQDTGIYVGQDDSMFVRHNAVSECVMGIEVENCTHVTVEHNISRNNMCGIEVDVLPNRILTATSNVLIANNLVDSNNAPNPVTDPEDILIYFPSGVGIDVMGADNVTVANNNAMNNNSAGIAIRRVPSVLSDMDPLIDPFPDGDVVTDNIVRNNGANVDPKLSPLPGADLLWDQTGTGNTWSANIYRTSFPIDLSGGKGKS